MILVLTENDFVNNQYSLRYGENMEALFQIVDAQFQGLGVEKTINRINILTRTIASDGTPGIGNLQSPIIGIGNGIVGIRTNNAALRGQTLSRNNMAECEVLLYESDGTA